ncbi:Phosphonate ABC transporter phosphate-binding periplasmic component (TC 3.A.1.9.1) [Helicobacter typhlonius]|uniref:Phosphonate ABC transporter phosphate-binding periplasmic component (TC 3.A.1.9.1) n=1 Tax=Helicobacter typhlonius TaxID=76936 RepID=A0A0S4PUA3_9HELI|nr:PhnD/SsuA/transferrin family substrate-binding protein [Helicobacter typhlonius]CUU39318.1 Phosphonate ABC transporter phosphate-binding periplasmic component (TC 3.A.1.9.1) [Helicobacter typhlonius]
MKSILVGAVAYAPQIVPIWDTIREYANDYFKDIRLDYVLFSNYERQVQWLKEGKIDIAWNTNVAFIRSRHCTNNGAEAILMRDTDIGFKSVFVAKRDTMKGLEDLKGKKFGLGSLDSAQAAIMPLFYLQQASLALKEMPLDSLHQSSAMIHLKSIALIAMWANTAIQGEVNLMCWIK